VGQPRILSIEAGAGEGLESAVPSFFATGGDLVDLGRIVARVE